MASVLLLQKGMSDIEKDTNTTLQKKYFADASQVLSKSKPVKHKKIATSRIIDASQVSVKGSRTLVRSGKNIPDDIIKVQVVRENNMIKTIKIKCPCGRSEELDCEYSPEI